MPVRKIFSDGDGNELQAYVNDKDKLFISVGDPKDDSPGFNQGYITLDRSDLNEFIDLLTDLRDMVFDESDLEDPAPARSGGILVSD